MVTPYDVIMAIKSLSDNDPRLHAFGCGPKYDIQDDIKYYPYLWVINEDSHNLEYSDVNGYRSVEYSFTLRVGDKVNNQKGGVKYGLNGNNNLQIVSSTFVIMTDIINSISENSIGLFDNISLIDSISIDPFHNEDDGDVSGFEATLTFRVKNDNPCISPITDLT